MPGEKVDLTLDKGSPIDSDKLLDWLRERRIFEIDDQSYLTLQHIIRTIERSR